MMRHGGNRIQLARLAGCAPEEILDFSVNLNPLGIPDGVEDAYCRAVERLSEYPEPYSESLCRIAAERLGVKPEHLLFGNGSNQLLSLVPRALKSRRARIVVPGYLEYRKVCERAGLPVSPFFLDADFRLDFEALSAGSEPGDLLILGNPNNPNGALVPPEKIRSFAQEHPEIQVLVDEAFIDFVGPESSLLSGPLPPNLLLLRSLTKFYGIPGLRIGYLAGAAVPEIRALQEEWMLSVPAEAAAEAVFRARNDFAERSRSRTSYLRGVLAEELRKIRGLRVFPSDACYLLVKGEKDPSEFLLKKHRIAVRSCGNYEGLSELYFRLAVREEKEMMRLIAALREFCGEGPSILLPRRKPALMIQGTASNAGKSVLCAAFCRIFLQDGFRVMPFKAQNMALNSYVTLDGGEMGRAQVLQAQACRLEPDVRMNPILLKPSGDTGSQVIVRGKPVGSMRVREYYARKKELWKDVTRSYDELCEEADLMVLEGAGSPGEVNLKSGDIVNMAMARYAEASVLLAGDIDRGGVYASFLGTWMTLSAPERALLAGFLVNKFRGDSSLLGPAHDYLLRRTGKPVLGVIDYLPRLDLPEEDSVNFLRSRSLPKRQPTLDVALIALGHIANFTDFDPLEREPDVQLRKVFRAEELGTPDVIVMPGSKNVPEDLRRLRKDGMERALREQLERGAWYIGICGGLQMAGRVIDDPCHLEAETGSSVEGLGLLPLRTVLRPEKTLRRSSARESDGTSVSGYEIHHGETSAESDSYVTQVRDDGTPVGFGSGRIWTTYLHGIFDEDDYRRKFLDRIRCSRGLPPIGKVLVRCDTERILDELADHVRSRVNLKQIYSCLGWKR